MHVSYVILAITATLLASANAEAATADSIDKKTFTITSPGSNDTSTSRVGTDDAQTTQDSGDDDSSSDEDDSASNGQEERGAGVSAGTAKKLKKQFSGEYDNVLNRFLRHLFDKMTPSNRRLPDPSKVPAHLRPLRLNADG
uniref:RxLR effector protein n=1 Tax=Phytophthora ramorum TaxID=164328 RepID=H3GPL0_PHYRM